MSQPDVVYSIFVSSTTGDDLRRYRTRARDILLTHNMRPLSMEYFPAESGSVRDAIDRYLSSTDGVVLIAGARYGSLIEHRSYVEWEFERAIAKEIPVICLVMSEEERNRVPVPETERYRQERFIELLKEKSKVAEFDEANFDLALTGALRLFPRQLRKGAGLIRMTDHDDVLESASFELRNMKSYQSALRLLSGIGLIQEHTKNLEGGGSRSMTSDDDRVVLDRFLNLLYQDLANRPVVVRIIETMMRRLIKHLSDFSEPPGFIPDSFGQLKVSIDELFGKTLSTLKATSIHSNHEGLISYKGYWQDNELGPFFKLKNEQFLALKGNRRLLRVYACDSIASAVGEEWFAATVIQQVSQGATVKVIEIDPDRIFTYEDFGIYEHRSGKNAAGSYLLLAPRDRNLRQPSLTTSITANSRTVADYASKFEALWKQSAEPLQLLDSARLEEADNLTPEKHGRGRAEDLFGRRIILRSMRRIDTKENLLASRGFVRKYQQPYAKAISDHVRSHFPGVRHMIYIGDTHKNDGTAIRNLQALGWDVTGFICEPNLGIARLWFNKILYTNRWTDLIGFADKVRENVGPNMLALFDIDQTVWAPKGVRDQPLINSRTRAMSSLIDGYVNDSRGEVAKKAKARVKLLYDELSKVEYLDLTLDNEDFKAAICVFLSLNLIFNPRGLQGEGTGIFEDIGRYDDNRFLNFVTTGYLPSFTPHESADQPNISRLIIEMLSAAQTDQYSRYGDAHGILVAKVLNDLGEIFRKTHVMAPIQYTSFRAKELKETLACVDEHASSDDQLVLSKPAWDMAMWLKNRKALLFALSDRPDESTISPDGESLLDASMVIYGKDISGFLSDLPA